MYRILHIEASESIRMLLADVFNSFYIDVELVSFENWAVAKRHTILGANFDLIILDEFSPEKEYAAVHKEICRAFPQLMNSILITTTHKKAAHFDHKFIKKPFNLEYLLTVINGYKSGYKIPLVHFKEYMAENKICDSA